MASEGIVFVQGFGQRDLFTGVPPEEMWGWQRNVGLLLALLRRYHIPWQEVYAPSLQKVKQRGALYFLRDGRYTEEEVSQFRRRFPDTPLISMAFQGPQPLLQAQREGEERALFPMTPAQGHETGNHKQTGLFLADHVVVRSSLNADCFASLGYPREKMVLLPHAPGWTWQKGEIVPGAFPHDGYQTKPGSRRQTERTLHLLFVGESLWRKGLFRLYRAFQDLPISNKCLHIYSQTLSSYALGQAHRGSWLDWPAELRAALAQLLSDPAVILHAPYRDVRGLVAAHAGIDLMVVPSLFDNGPNTLMEGYQLGTPLLASSLCGAVFDLPRGAVSVVEAPQWWREREKPSAFTERLSAVIWQACQSQRVTPLQGARGGGDAASPSADLLFAEEAKTPSATSTLNLQQRSSPIKEILSGIVEVWKKLLSRYIPLERFTS